MASAEHLIQTGLLGEAVDSGPALVFVADDLMRYVAVNQAACDVLGYARSELLALRVPDVAREAAAPDQYRELISSGVRTGMAVLTRKDGSEFPFAYRAQKTAVGGLKLYVSVGFAGE